jgi:histone H3/H4
MKINITGSGMIPGVNAVPPVRGIELDEKTIRNLLNYPRFRLFQTSTGFSINRRNIDKILKSERANAKVAVGIGVAKEIEIPKTVVEAPVIETVQEVTPVETYEESKAESIPNKEEIPNTVPVIEGVVEEISESAPVVEETDEAIEEAPVEETVEEAVAEEVTEEPKEETTEEKKPYYNKKKKNRH